LCDECVRLCMRIPPHNIQKCFHNCGIQFGCGAHCGHQYDDITTITNIINDYISNDNNNHNNDGHEHPREYDNQQLRNKVTPIVSIGGNDDIDSTPKGDNNCMTPLITSFY
jgi:hypothetical protein